jgi:hypothetical protein
MTPADLIAAAQLKRCPLCGGVATCFPTNPSVSCTLCGCEVWGDTIHQAVARWNTRTPQGQEQ